jgi:hypothetical protein
MEEVFNYLRKIFKPYSNLPIFNELPKEGIPKQEILELLSKFLLTILYLYKIDLSKILDFYKGLKNSLLDYRA